MMMRRRRLILIKINSIAFHDDEDELTDAYNDPPCPLVLVAIKW